MELVGRDPELAVLAHALDEVRGGRGRVLGVLGEAGIGKSALLAALGERAARAGVPVLEGRGVEHERQLPFAVAVAALDGQVAGLHPSRLRALGVDLGAVLPSAGEAAPLPVAVGAGERFRLHRALRAFVEELARERPVALLVDDLHWVDEASVEWLLHLLRRPPAGAHLLVFASRPVDPLARVLDAARGAPGFESLALEPLGHQESLRVLADVRDRAVRERLAQEARGNPLFLRELARVGNRVGEQLPSTLLAAIAVEVGALEPATQALVRGAAVVGDPFDPELAAAAVGVEPDADALDALVRADLVRARPDARAFAFRHPLVRRAIYDGAPPAWRLAAHERVAAALARRGAAAPARAFHVARFATVSDEAAIALLCEAAATAAGTAPATAAHWYGAALRLVPEADTGRRAALLAPMALALAGAGRLADSREALVEVLRLLEPAPTPQRLALVTACAQVETELGLHAAARRRLRAALAGAPPVGRAGLEFELAAAAFQEGRVTELRERSLVAVRAATEAGDGPLLAGAEALEALGALWSADVAGADAALDRATAGLSALDDSLLAARSAVPAYVGSAQLLSERFADGAATTARALAVLRRTGHGQVLVRLLVTRAMALFQLLDLDPAVREVATAEEIARLQRAPRPLCFALWMRALIHYERGESAEAERAAAEYASAVRAVEPSNITRNGTINLAAIRARDEPDRALREILATAGPRLEQSEPSWTSWLALHLVRAAIATGRLQDAERFAQLATSHTERLRLPAGSVRATCARAEILLATGDASRAAALAEQAATAADRIPAHLDAAEARLLAARAHAAAGDTEHAKSLFQQLATDAARGAALRLHDDAARELRRLGTHVSAAGRRAARRNDDNQLTAREHDVATLVAEGHTNQQVAAALHLSVGTIENTLTRIYAKYGVRSRSQLARKLTDS